LMKRRLACVSCLASLVFIGLNTPRSADAACCYFSAKNSDILQPAQKAFITWDPNEKVETFTVQPKFEGNALDFGMVIPTPSQPKLNEMPRDFFKHLAIYTIMKRREMPNSKLLWLIEPPPSRGEKNQSRSAKDGDKKSDLKEAPPPPKVIILEEGVARPLDYKNHKAQRRDA